MATGTGERMAAGTGGRMAAGTGGGMAAGTGGRMAAGAGGRMAAETGGRMATGTGGSMAAGRMAAGRMAAGKTKQERRRTRSLSKEGKSIEQAVDTNKMYDYYMDQSKGITKKAETDRGMLAKLLDMVKQIRQFDLKRIRNKEIEELNLNITGLKTDWSDVKASLQDKVTFVEGIQRRHGEEVQTYEEFCDYLEPGSLKEKIKVRISDIKRKSRTIKAPVQDLKREKEYLLAVKERAMQDVEEQERKNAKLRARVERSEMDKDSASLTVTTMRE